MPIVNVRKHTDDTVSIDLELEGYGLIEYDIETIEKLHSELGMAIRWYNSLVGKEEK